MYTAIIPARKGSLRVKNKNTRPFAGTTLVNLAIECAKEIKQITRIVLNSDNPKLLNVAEKYGIEFHLRGFGDGPMQQVVDTVKAKRKILLQPTSPLRTPEIVYKAMDMFMENEHNPVFSVSQKHKTFIPNGDVFVFTNQIYTPESIMFISGGIDIDTEQDFKAAEALYTNRQKL